MHKILIIDDDADIIAVLEKRLIMAGYQVFPLSETAQLIEKVKEIGPDLIILDVMLPDNDGFVIKRLLNNAEETAHIPVIFLTAKQSLPDKLEGLYLGGEDYISKPFNCDEVLARVQGILQRRDSFEEKSMKDPLLGINNVAFYQKQITLFFNIARRYGNMFSLSVLDFDKFKYINDANGHLTGDYVLKQFCEIAQKTIRDTDILARYGGDEFVIIMPGINGEQARAVMRKLEEAVAKHEFICAQTKQLLPVSITTGTCEYNDSFQSTEEMFHEADAKMYERKKMKKSLPLPFPKTKTVLIVDDDPDISMVLSARLSKEGYGVMLAADGAVGLELAKKERPVLIILDLMLPSLPGEEVCRQVRKDPLIYNTPIIMLTAKSMEADRIIGRVIGADCYLCKPYEIEDLLAKIKEFLKNV